jgi:uncharacterized membrane protein
MHKEMTSSNSRAGSDLEATMQRVSLLISLVGLGLMVAGFIDMLIVGASLSVPGRSVLALPKLAHPSQVPISLAVMSAGIVLLALLPALRVLLALGLYLRRHNILNALVALIVFMELLLSMRAGG